MNLIASYENYIYIYKKNSSKTTPAFFIIKYFVNRQRLINNKAINNKRLKNVSFNYIKFYSSRQGVKGKIFLHLMIQTWINL